MRVKQARARIWADSGTVAVCSAAVSSGRRRAESSPVGRYSTKCTRKILSRKNSHFLYLFLFFMTIIISNTTYECKTVDYINSGKNYEIISSQRAFIVVQAHQNVCIFPILLPYLDYSLWISGCCNRYIWPKQGSSIHTRTSESGMEWVPSPGRSKVIRYVLFTVSRASITPVNNPSWGFRNRAATIHHMMYTFLDPTILQQRYFIIERKRTRNFSLTLLDVNSKFDFL